MAPHSSTLAWKIPWMEEPGGLQSMGSMGVGYNWATSLSLFTCMHWRRKWQPTPVFLPGESQGRGSLVGCRLWGHAESDTTKRLSSSNRILWCMLLCADLPPDLVWLQKFSFIVFSKLYIAYMFNKWLLILYGKSWKGWLDGDKSRSSKS